jgi:hypothetical protein
MPSKYDWSPVVRDEVVAGGVVAEVPDVGARPVGLVGHGERAVQRAALPDPVQGRGHWIRILRALRSAMAR